jgi:uncharacterized protein YndB with AHSA1/START domain
MLLLKENPGDVWSARAAVTAEAAEVLRALTDPELIADWAPISFELDEPGGKLRAGSHERVSGSIAGVRASFDVDVTRADLGRLELVAEGALAMDVVYHLREQGGRVLVDATVGVRRRGGLGGQVMRAAVAALLNAGALDRALARLAESVGDCSRRELVAA